MKMSTLFGKTLRERPGGVESTSHALLERAGYIRQVGAGIFAYLPLALRVIRKIEAVLRREMEAIGGREVLMPLAQPADLWRESGRYYSIDAELGRFADRQGRHMVLAMTHEEALTFLARSEISTYRQLPACVYHIQLKWRDDPRPRAGLLRVREFTMKDSYSLDVDEAGLEVQYRAHYDAYHRIFAACGLPVEAVSSDSGQMGGSEAHEFMYYCDAGEDTVIRCLACGYAANRQVARFTKDTLPPEPERPLEEVATPGAATIAELSAYLDLPPRRLAKVVFYTAACEEPEGASMQDAAGTNGRGVAGSRLIVAVIRGDMEVSESKLLPSLSGAGIGGSLRPATEEEILAAGAVPGYGSPMGLQNALIAVDDGLQEDTWYVTGANRAGYHLKGLRIGRDFRPDVRADFAAAGEGHGCPCCGSPLSAHRAVEVGNIFKLGTRYSESMGCMFQDRDGTEKPVVMGSYGIGVGRLMACIVEEHNDEKGILWPIRVAPFQVHVVDLTGGAEEAGAVVQALETAGVEVLHDDRDARPGVKFNDADLIGIPIRITIGRRGLEEGTVEIKERAVEEKRQIPLKDAVRTVMDLIESRG